MAKHAKKQSPMCKRWLCALSLIGWSTAKPSQGTRSLLRFRANMQGLGWGHTLERVGLAGAKMSCRPLISALIFVIVLNAQIFAAEPRPGAPKTYLSPDQTLRVFVVPLPNAT